MTKDERMSEGLKNQIAAGRKIQIHYTVEADGEIVDSTRGRPPHYYIHGGNALLPAIQKHLEGKFEGDSVEFVLTPEEAYGPWRPEALVEVPKSEMPPRELKPGMILQEDLPDGKVRVGRVAEIRADAVVMNFNHPMAGKTLHYKVRIHSVNDC